MGPTWDWQALGSDRRETEMHKVSNKAGRQWLAAAVHVGWTASWYLVYVANREAQNVAQQQKQEVSAKPLSPQFSGSS